MRCLCVGLALSCSPGLQLSGGPIYFLSAEPCRAWGTGREPLAAEILEVEAPPSYKKIPGTEVIEYTPLLLIYKPFAQFKLAQGFPQSSLRSYGFILMSICALALHFKILPILPSQQLS